MSEATVILRVVVESKLSVISITRLCDDLQSDKKLEEMQ